MKKINLEEILKKHDHLYMPYSVKDTEGKFRRVIDQDGAIEAMKEAIQQALELAAENAEMTGHYSEPNMSEGIRLKRFKRVWQNRLFRIETVLKVDKESILNTINQIE